MHGAADLVHLFAEHPVVLPAGVTVKLVDDMRVVAAHARAAVIAAGIVGRELPIVRRPCMCRWIV
jgi:hypothetical protein